MDNKDYMNPEQLELVRQEQCKQYKKENDCYGCIYYDPENQECQFDE